MSPLYLVPVRRLHSIDVFIISSAIDDYIYCRLFTGAYFSIMNNFFVVNSSTKYLVMVSNVVIASNWQWFLTCTTCTPRLYIYSHRVHCTLEVK